MVPGTMILRNQTSVLGVDFATGNMTDNLSLARPGYNNVADLATTRVMSPIPVRALANKSANPVMECNNSFLLGQHFCQVCSQVGSDLAVCAECGVWDISIV